MSIWAESSETSVSEGEAVLTPAARSVSRGEAVLTPAAHTRATLELTATAIRTQAESSEISVLGSEAVLTPAARGRHAKADGEGDENASWAAPNQRAKPLRADVGCTQKRCQRKRGGGEHGSEQSEPARKRRSIQRARLHAETTPRPTATAVSAKASAAGPACKWRSAEPTPAARGAASQRHSTQPTPAAHSTTLGPTTTEALSAQASEAGPASKWRGAKPMPAS